MELAALKRRLSNRYLSLIYLEAVMIFIHTRVIPIHPLIFLVWPLSLWLLIEIITRFRENRFKMLLFSATFVAYVLITQILVVERPEGVFFDLEPVHNMPILSLLVLGEAVLLYLYDAFVARSITFRDIAAYVGFASVIPWLSPSIVEAFVLARWFMDGSFVEMTAGKGIGGAGFNDILFRYGGRNLVVSSLICSAGMIAIHGGRMMARTREDKRLRRKDQEEDRKWMEEAWENPITLLSERDQAEFLEAHRHLDDEQQRNILRNEILPTKGITLEDPGER